MKWWEVMLEVGECDGKCTIINTSTVTLTQLLFFIVQ